jgi:hypothetical protein
MKMKLNNFPYRTTSSIISYSQSVTSVIALFNKFQPSIGVIAQDTNYCLPNNEDRLDYWDKWNSDITFGRYLQFTNNNSVVIPFWTGFSSTVDETIYCIWFEKKNPFLQYFNNGCLNNIKNLIIRDSCRELWILMDDSDLKNLGNDCTSNGSQIINNFWYRVLEVLQ